MKYCKYCKTKIDTTNDFCPLCFNHIEEIDNSSEMFYTPRKTNDSSDKIKHFIVKLFLFLSICAIITCFIVNYLVNFNIQWFWLVGFGILYVWVLIAHTIMSRQSVFKKIFLQIISIALILYFSERISASHDWLFQYVFPSVSFSIILVLTIILLTDKNKSASVIGFMFIILLLFTVSLLLLIFNLVQFKLLNLINCMLCFLTILAYFIFGYHAIKQDLSKKFHL